MKSIYSLVNYNNYYNRVIKMKSTLNEYLSDAEDYHRTDSVNFIKKNSIFTVQVIGSRNNHYEGDCDYLLVVDESGAIESRWFIIDSEFLTEGQYKLTLQRDVIADFYSIIQESPFYVEKGWINNSSSVLNLQKEPSINVNQIKKSEVKLRQSFECSPFVAMFYTRAKDGTDTMKGTIKINANYFNQEITGTVQDIFGSKEFYTIDKMLHKVKYFDNKDLSHIFIVQNVIDVLDNSNPSYFDGYENESVEFKPGDFVIPNGKLKNLPYLLHNKYNKKRDLLYSLGREYLPATETPQIEFDEIYNKYGKGDGILVKDSSGDIYSVKLEHVSDVKSAETVSAGALYNEYWNSLDSIIKGDWEGNKTQPFEIEITMKKWKYTINKIQQANILYDMNDPDKIITKDSPYNIALVPLDKNIRISFGVGGLDTVVSGLDVVAGIAEQQNSRILDAQIIPYIDPSFLDPEEDIITLTDPHSYSLVKDSAGNNLTVIINIPSSRFTGDIFTKKFMILMERNRKLSNECEKWRITAPDYSSYFDFSMSAFLDIEELNGFNFDCDLKPYNSYIHVNPKFTPGSIYGKDYNDPRGMIFSPKSITLLNDQWQQYQTFNRTYEQTFSRQVQNLEINQDVQRFNDIVGGIGGTIAGTAGGGFVGNLFGGGVAGGIAGGIASGIGGIIDYKINESLRSEQMDYMRDMHELNIQRIKALPDTLRTVSAINSNNKLYPMLEYYSCSFDEVQYVKSKLKYDSMTINVISERGFDKYLNYFSDLTFIKGYPIRLKGIYDDSMICNQIRTEFQKGVYIYDPKGN